MGSCLGQLILNEPYLVIDTTCFPHMCIRSSIVWGQLQSQVTSSFLLWAPANTVLQLPFVSLVVSCDPSCVHGVCVDTNVCVCGEGYEGPICNTTGKATHAHSGQCIIMCHNNNIYIL